MKLTVFAAAGLVLHLATTSATAQTAGVTPEEGVVAPSSGSSVFEVQPAEIDLRPDRPLGSRFAASLAGSTPTRLQPPSLVNAVGHDLVAFFSPSTAKIVGAFTFGGITALHWDNDAVDEARETLPGRASSVGNVGGGLLVQAGAGAAVYLIGRSTTNPQLSALGSDLIRAQVLSQIVVQGTKFAVGRTRPDASNSQSFPSGHTASAFATATVLQQHFGWKVGIPSYAFAAFVGESRMASQKHYLSDVIMGAGIGIAAGRTVTIGLGHQNFSLGVAPTRGGAMVSFSKQP